MKKIFDLKKYGTLYIDKVIFETYIPLIFTCRNSNGDLFFCVCCQSNKDGFKWLLGKTTGGNVVKLLKDEITVRQLPVDYSVGKISVDCIDNEFTDSYGNSDWDLNSKYLPKKDSYMYADDGEFDEEIDYFIGIDRAASYAAEYKSILQQTIREISEIDENTFSGNEISDDIIRRLIEVSEIILKKMYANPETYKASYKTVRTVNLSVQSDDAKTLQVYDGIFSAA